MFVALTEAAPTEAAPTEASAQEWEIVDEAQAADLKQQEYVTPEGGELLLRCRK